MSKWEQSKSENIRRWNTEMTEAERKRIKAEEKEIRDAEKNGWH